MKKIETYSTFAQMEDRQKVRTVLNGQVAVSDSFLLDDNEPTGCDAYVFVLTESGTATIEINYVHTALTVGSLLMLNPTPLSRHSVTARTSKPDAFF